MSTSAEARQPDPATPDNAAQAALGPVMVVDALTKRWGPNVVLNGASFTVGRGVTGLLGANGAGKTTFLGMVLGFHKADAGTLRVFGLDPWTSGPEVRARVGYAAEHEALPPDVRAHDFVRHVAELHKIPAKQAIARASDALFEVGLGEERFRALGTMSTGQKQRVKLAQAIVHDPSLVLLDEPTNGLDPMQRDQLLALIQRCGSELGLNIVLSSHLLDEVERTCDRVIILAGGIASGGGDVAALEGDGAYIEVDIVGDISQAMVALRDGGLNVVVDPMQPTRLLCEFAGDSTYVGIARALSTANIGVRRIRRQRRTLEDAFLAASGAA
jgi:ABC-2 type transport system ATP-binding protein